MQRITVFLYPSLRKTQKSDETMYLQVSIFSIFIQKFFDIQKHSKISILFSIVIAKSLVYNCGYYSSHRISLFDTFVNELLM